MIYVTGDCHGDFSRFSSKRFPDQKEMTKDDYVIVLGDFGLWHDTKSERYWLRWLNDKPFTTLFVDGNHENFDRLYSDEFPVVNFHGGKAHQIRDHIFHLMRGYVFDLEGKTFFSFGGASSHDVNGGIFNRCDYVGREKVLHSKCRFLDTFGIPYRINHEDWWAQELPSDEEMQRGIHSLNAKGNHVDFVISHCAPQHIAAYMSCGLYKPDVLTRYFDLLLNNGLQFGSWYFGHYHRNERYFISYNALYRHIVRIV